MALRDCNSHAYYNLFEEDVLSAAEQFSS